MCRELPYGQFERSNAFGVHPSDISNLAPLRQCGERRHRWARGPLSSSNLLALVHLFSWRVFDAWFLANEKFYSLASLRDPSHGEDGVPNPAELMTESRADTFVNKLIDL